MLVNVRIDNILQNSFHFSSLNLAIDLKQILLRLQHMIGQNKVKPILSNILLITAPFNIAIYLNHTNYVEVIIVFNHFQFQDQIQSGLTSYVHGNPEFLQPFLILFPWYALSGSFTLSPSIPSMML